MTELVELAIVRECAHPVMRFSNLVAAEVDDDTLSWFNNRCAYFYLNARAAIRSACDALQIGRGDEVLVPAYNCGSEVDPILASGADVSMYRVDQSSAVDLASIEERISPRTKAVYVTHYFGFPQQAIVDMKSLCERRGLYLIEDCALSLFGALDGVRLGSFGDVSVFSFEKFFPTIGGGALLVNSPASSRECRPSRPAPTKFVLTGLARALQRELLDLRGWPVLVNVLRRALGRNAWSNEGSMAETAVKEDPSSPEDIPRHYYFDPTFENAGMSLLTRRILRSSSVNKAVRSRRANFKNYLEILDGRDDIDCLFRTVPKGVCPQIFPVLVRNRNQIYERLSELGIGATPWWRGYHNRLDWSDFPEARDLKENVLALPLHQPMAGRHIDVVCRRLISIIDPKARPEQPHESLA